MTDDQARIREPGRDYEWFVAVMPDPKNHSADTVARGAINQQPGDFGIRGPLDVPLSPPA